MNPLFELSQVSFSYTEKVPALHEIDFAIEAGSRIALVGENGSGKSTLLRVLDGLYFPQKGSVKFEGTSLSEQSLNADSFGYEFRRRVAYLFQDPEVQLFSSTVWDEVCFAPLQLRWNQEIIRERVLAVLNQLGLASLKERPPFRLSLGEKKKVALASILVIDPQVLLLDEPLAALDPKTQSVLLELLYSWSRKQKTIITSTHDLGMLKEIADEVYVMQQGRFVYKSTPSKLLEEEELLQKFNLIHAHTHKHADQEHHHPHTHDLHSHDH